MKEFIPVLNLSSTAVHCTSLQCFWIAFIISPVPPPKCNSSPVHALLWLSTCCLLKLACRLLQCRECFTFRISQPVWMNCSSALHGNQVWLSCKWGKPTWRWTLCKKTAAIRGRRRKLRSCQLHGSFCYWVLFGPCIVNWIIRRKSSDWLKLVPTLAEALGSLQHSHIYQFYLHILWEASLGVHTFFCLNLYKLRLNEKTNILYNMYPSGSSSWSWIVLQGVKQICQWDSCSHLRPIHILGLLR